MGCPWFPVARFRWSRLRVSQKGLFEGINKTCGSCAVFHVSPSLQTSNMHPLTSQQATTPLILPLVSTRKSYRGPRMNLGQEERACALLTILPDLHRATYRPRNASTSTLTKSIPSATERMHRPRLLRHRQARPEISTLDGRTDVAT